MPKTRRGLRSSRRVESLQDSDIDHEIIIVDHDGGLEHPQRLSADSDDSIELSVSGQPLVHSESTAPLTGEASKPSPLDSPNGMAPETGTSTVDDAEDHTVLPTKGADLCIVIEQPTPNENGHMQNGGRGRLPKPSNDPETAIDILYENERGGFLCGFPLFSSAALGNLDPSPWTNFAHKPSPTDINTAQVPDPSWQWAWPEWRINRDECIKTDNDGWEYSFMFSKKFSWHGPRWYNSFVRRRAWIRRRIKKGLGYQADDPHLLNEGYFQITPKHKHDLQIRDGSHSRTSSVAGRTSLSVDPRASIERSHSRASTRASRCSGAFFGENDVEEADRDIETVEELMIMLRRSRIDREKLEAVENYIKHTTDDLQLENYMHEIMSIFVFQASRKALLSRLTQISDELAESANAGSTSKDKGKAADTDADNGAEVERRKKNLAAAIKHADEEVRKLEYWSDIKAMAENGESGGAVDCDKGWNEDWVGLDKSGAKGARKEELPS